MSRLGRPRSLGLPKTPLFPGFFRKAWKTWRRRARIGTPGSMLRVFCFSRLLYDWQEVAFLTDVSPKLKKCPIIFSEALLYGLSLGNLTSAAFASDAREFRQAWRCQQRLHLFYGRLVQDVCPLVLGQFHRTSTRIRLPETLWPPKPPRFLKPWRFNCHNDLL